MNERLSAAGVERMFPVGLADAREFERRDADPECRAAFRRRASSRPPDLLATTTCGFAPSVHGSDVVGKGGSCLTAADPSRRVGAVRQLVLVVEDEPLLLIMASDMIEDAGFDVVTAANADEALVALRSRADVRIMFTDIRMPGSMDGLALAATVRDRFPPVEIVVTSGHERPSPSQLPTRGLFLPKPYQERELVAVMQSLSI